MENVKYYNAYNEVLEIIKYLNKEDLSKIPEFNFKAMRDHSNPDYKFVYNPELPMDVQGVSVEARALLMYLFEKYIATEKQKEVLRDKKKQAELIEENLKKEKYSPDNLFEEKHIPVEEGYGIVTYKEKNVFQKMLEKIMNVFKEILRR